MHLPDLDAVVNVASQNVTKSVTSSRYKNIIANNNSVEHAHVTCNRELITKDSSQSLLTQQLTVHYMVVI